MATILKPTTYQDLVNLVQSLVMAVGGGLLSREQATSAFKDQLYMCEILKRPAPFEKVEKVVIKKV